jgi:hypothetical protein
MKFISVALYSLFLVLCSCVTPEPKPEPFTVDMKSIGVALGTAEVYIDRSFTVTGGIKTADVEVSYYPIEDAVCLSFKVMIIECKQFWDREGRNAFVAALERYNEDFANRNLPEGSVRNMRKAYGSVQGYFAWKTSPVSVQAHAPVRIDFGYHRKERSAFFSTTQQVGEYNNPKVPDRSRKSAITEMYFTRDQADALASLFAEADRRSGSPSFAPEQKLDIYEDEQESMGGEQLEMSN